MALARVLTLSALVVVLAAPPSAAVGPGDFEEPSTSPESTEPLGSDVTAADFNVDGHTDLAVSERGGGGSVTVLLGDGNGDFNPAPNSPFPAPSPANAIASGDFDGDDNPDLAVAGGIFSGELMILLGDGTGDFTEPASSPHSAGFAPQDVVAGRFDGNPTIDLVVTDHKFGLVTIFLGDGAGDFTEPGSSPEGVGTNPWPIAVADFNDDENSDLAVGSEFTGDVTILLGDGAGDFTEAATSPETSPGDLFAIASGDFNGDHNVDLAVPSLQDSNVTILLGDGAGDFDPSASSPEAAGMGTHGIVARDLSRDGIVDLATANYVSNDVTVLLGGGNGDFTEVPTSPEAADFTPVQIAIGDFDEDGSPDLAVVNQDGNDVTILLNTSPGPPSPQNPPSPPGPGSPPGEPPPGEAPPAGSCRSQAATIVGKSGDDSLQGTPGDDIIFGMAGDDRAFGGAGNDLICLGEGDDLGRGGKGNDLVIGNLGGDEVLGNKGIDQLFGRRDDDALNGGKGADLCGGGQGTDTKTRCEASPH